MDQLENLARLEEAIDKLLRSQQEMRQEKLQLQAKLDQQEKETAAMRKQLEEAQADRGNILKRVAGLIDSIDNWEKSGDARVSEEAGVKSGEGKTLF